MSISVRVAALAAFSIALTTACSLDVSRPATPPPCALPATITISPATARVAIGDTLRLSAVPSARTCDASSPFTPISVWWSSADSAIASVDSLTGLVVGRALGTTAIRATADGVTGAATLAVVAR